MLQHPKRKPTVTETRVIKTFFEKDIEHIFALYAMKIAGVVWFDELPSSGGTIKTFVNPEFVELAKQSDKGLMVGATTKLKQLCSAVQRPDWAK